MSIGTSGFGRRWLALIIACGCWPGTTAPAEEPPAGVPAMPPSTPIRLRGEPFFPVGLYQYPRHDDKVDVFKAIADAGFNLYLLPATASREQLDAAAANGRRIMLVVADTLNLSGTPEEVARKKETLAKLVGPGSVACDHPAVVALEGPDESIWNLKMTQGQRDKLSPELATWVRTPQQKEEIHALLKGLRDGYAEVRRLCGDR